MQRKSIRSDAFSFILGSTGLVVEHANVLKCGPLLGQHFHVASKVLVDARELAKAKRFNYGKSWIRLCEPAGKHWEKLQRCLSFIRQELPLCGTCNYQPCAQQEGIMARIRWVPNACFKLYAFKALKKFVNLNWVGKNSYLAHTSLDVGGIAHPPLQWSESPTSN